MKKAAKRGAKRAVIATTDNDPTSGQPSEKIAKGVPEKSSDADPVADISSLKWTELRDKLRAAGLSTAGGTKAVFAKRLSEYMSSISVKAREKMPANEEDEQMDANPYPLNVVELQQKVIELEEKLQWAIRQADEANIARESAECLLDSKPVILADDSGRVVELQMSLAELSAQFEEAKENLENAETRNAELSQKYANLVRENAELNSERFEIQDDEMDDASQEGSIDDLKKMLANARRREEKAYNNNRKLHYDNAALHTQVANLKSTIDSRTIADQQMQETVNFLNDQLGKLRVLYNEEQARNGNAAEMQEDQKPPRMQHLQPNDELKREISRLWDQLEEARTEAEAGKITIDALTLENFALREELDALKSKMHETTVEKEQLACDNVSLKEQLRVSKAIESTSNELAIENRALENQVEELRRKMQDAAVRMGELTLANSTLEKKLEEAGKEEENAKNRAVGQADKNSELNEELNDFKRKVLNITTEKRTLKQKLEEVGKEAENAKNLAVEQADKNSALKAELDDLRRKVLDMTAKKELADHKGKFKKELDEENGNIQDPINEEGDPEPGEITFREELEELRRTAQDMDKEKERIANQKLKERVNFLTNQLENAQRVMNHDRARIDHLVHRLALYEGWQQQPAQMQHPQQGGWPHY